MLIYQTDSENIVNKERYFFELQAPATSGTFNSDRYLNEYEQELSAALYKLAERVKTLPALGSQTKFKLHIHTTQSSFTQLNQDAQQQEFPWMITTTETKHNAKLLPLVNIESLGLKMEAHIVS
ncbi:uncharacterized protein LOC108601749 [Drosophila busckii]|uniref:uncharacterized protein LOC108601749 n=1 Tax=Drosophila busckii TaxID=30019 RepID=UPI00083F5014|nr:uncharacterized protein LOC108601749 [Drosophila busckii]